MPQLLPTNHPNTLATNPALASGFLVNYPHIQDICNRDIGNVNKNSNSNDNNNVDDNTTSTRVRGKHPELPSNSDGSPPGNINTAAGNSPPLKGISSPNSGDASTANNISTTRGNDNDNDNGNDNGDTGTQTG